MRSTYTNANARGVSIPTLPGIAEEIWHDLLEGNQRFCDGRMTAHQVRTQREFLAAGQRPKAVVIGCSDSRVPPELVFDQTLGDLFVIRAAGNVIDAIALGSVEYAIDHLGTRLIVVLGHDRCGAVQAACAGGKTTSPHLSVIMSELKPSVRECSSQSGAALIRDVVEKNALRVAKALTYRSAILRKSLEDGNLQVVAARYDLMSGEVTRLEAPEEPLGQRTKENVIHSA